MKIFIDLSPTGHVSVEIDSESVVEYKGEGTEELLKDAADFLAAADKVNDSDKTFVGDGVVLEPIKKRVVSEETKRKISEAMRKNKLGTNIPTPKPWENGNEAFVGVPTLKCNKCNRIYTWQQKKLSPRCGSCGCEEYTVVEDE